MKKVLIIFAICLLLVGCGSNKTDNSNNSNLDNGKVTDFSKKYLSKGYIVNVYRTVIPLSDSLEDMGKGNVQITYSILANYYMNIDFDKKDEYLKSQTVKDIKIIKSPKMGTVDKIYGSYQSYINKDFLMTGSINTFKKTFDTPVNTPEQTSVAFILENVAFMDSMKYQGENTTRAIYDYLGIDNDAVSMKVSFRVEFETVGGKILYKDFIIDLPPSSYDIKGEEFRTDFLTEDVTQMEAFKEK